MKFDLIIVSSGFGNTPDATFILPPGERSYTVPGTHSSYGVTVEMPEGFELAQNILDQWRLWAPNGEAVDIFVYDRWDKPDMKYGQNLKIFYKDANHFVEKYARIENGVARFS